MNHIGRFVWHDLMTTDPAKSKAFYVALFPEWTIDSKKIDTPHGPFTYEMILVAGLKAGGLVPFDASYGIPSHWMSYVAVENCDAAIERAVAGGGKVCVPAFDAPDVGRFAVLSDPQGAYFKPMQLFKPHPLPDKPNAGQFCWDELLTTDIDAARVFYPKLFGWTVTDFDMGPAGKYTIWHASGKMVGGGMKMPAEAAGTPPNWLPYISAPDVDARFAKALTLGAKPYVPPRDIPGVGRFAVLAEPTGATFALFRGDM